MSGVGGGALSAPSESMFPKRLGACENDKETTSCSTRRTACSILDSVSDFTKNPFILV